MPIINYNVIQPPTAGELEAELRALPQLGSAALNLLVARVPDELSSRRSEETSECSYAFAIDSTSQGGTPYIIGHLEDNPTVTGRLEVVNGDLPDDERPLRLVLFDPGY